MRLTVRVLATPPVAYSLEDAVDRVMDLDLEVSEEWEPLRDPISRVSISDIDGHRVIDAHVQYFIRSETEGEIEVPRVQIGFGDGAEVESTAPPTVFVFRPLQGLYQFQRSVLPIEAIVRSELGGRETEVRRIGSAVLVGPDALLTSLHVIVDASKIEVELPSGRRVKVRKLWSVDPEADVAILEIDRRIPKEEGLYPLEFEPKAPDVGEAVFTVGWPGGKRQLTAGVVSNRAAFGRNSVLVSDNAIRPGDSGGPLLSSRGKILGIVTAGTVPSSLRDVLPEEVCIATDPTLAFETYTGKDKPLRMRKAFLEQSFASSTRVQAMRLMSTLQTGIGWRTFRTDFSAFEEAAVAERDPEIMFVRGNIYRALGRPVIAESSYRRALQLDRRHFLASYLLGVHHLTQDNFEGALNQFDHTIQHGGYPNLSVFGKARALLAMKEYSAAVQYYREVLQFDATYQPALFDLGVAYIAMGERKKAVQILASLRGLGVRWANRLELVLDNPVLQPITLTPADRARILSAN